MVSCDRLVSHPGIDAGAIVALTRLKQLLNMNIVVNQFIKDICLVAMANLL